VVHLKSIACIVGFIASVTAASAQQWYEAPAYYNPAPYRAPEQLRYKVKYGFIRLGTVEMRQKRLDTLRFESTMRMKTAAGVPLLNFDSYNKAILVPASSRCYHYTIDASASGGEKLTLHCEPSSGTVTIDQWNGEDGASHSTVKRTDPFYDGLGYIMLGRCLSASATTVTVASINKTEFRSSILRFSKNRERIEIGAIDGPIRARRIESEAAWKTSADLGISGSFRMWVSDDDAAVPLRAEVDIALGSITIELESWKREGWNPNRLLSSQDGR
jgi:hypothetical protein